MSVQCLILLMIFCLVRTSCSVTHQVQSEERMVFHGVSIPLKLVKPSTIRRAAVAESVEVPPMEEVIVDTYLDREEHVNGGGAGGGC